MTKREGAIVGAFTGFLCGDFADLQQYAEEKMGRPVWTHEFGNREFADALREASLDDFRAIATPANQTGAVIK